MAVEDRLTGFLRVGVSGEKKRLLFPEYSLLKLPSSRTRQAAIAIEINPGQKREVRVVRSASELNESLWNTSSVSIIIPTRRILAVKMKN